MDLNLRREEIGEDGERGSNQLWQELSEVLIRGIVVLDIFPRTLPSPGGEFLESVSQNVHPAPRSGCFPRSATAYVPPSPWPDLFPPEPTRHCPDQTASFFSDHCPHGSGNAQSRARPQTGAKSQHTSVPHHRPSVSFPPSFPFPSLPAVERWGRFVPSCPPAS